MAGYRAYIPQVELAGKQAGDVLTLSAAESKHLCGARRAEVGAPLTVFSGARAPGSAWQAQLTHACTRAAHITLTKALELHAPRVHTTLACAALKPSAWEAALVHATALGAHTVLPLITEHIEVKKPLEVFAKKATRWHTLMLEASKQSGQLYLPQLSAPTPLNNFLSTQPTTENHSTLLASLQPGSQPLLSALQNIQGAEACTHTQITLLLGPEGDFSPAEYAQLKAHPAMPVTLGTHVLRSEAAAQYMLSCVHAWAQTQGP